MAEMAAETELAVAAWSHVRADAEEVDEARESVDARLRVLLTFSARRRILKRLMRLTRVISLCPAVVHLGHSVDSLKRAMTFLFVFQLELSPQICVSFSTTSASNSFTPRGRGIGGVERARAALIHCLLPSASRAQYPLYPPRPLPRTSLQPLPRTSLEPRPVRLPVRLPVGLRPVIAVVSIHSSMGS